MDGSLVNRDVSTIARELESFHDLFRMLWQIGEPEFTRTIPTAAVVFSAKGLPLRFLFNPDFWDSLPAYDRTFVVCHEMLHAVLNHGFRCRKMVHPRIANVAADIAVNHLLVNRFGFKRELLQDWRSACWVDTVFTDPAKPPPANNLTVEEYYLLCRKEAQVILIDPIDLHLFRPGKGPSLSNPRAAVEVGVRMGDLGSNTLEEIREMLGKEGMVTGRGDQGLGVWAHVQPVRPKKVPWEQIVRQRLSQAKEASAPGWVSPDRRFSAESEWLLPGETITRKRVAGKRQRCVFFLDASGSTWGYIDRLLGLASTLPREHYDMVLCSFDTEVYLLDPSKSEVRGGGGTRFDILEEWLIHRERNPFLPQDERIPYPDIVFVLTDGDGTPVAPKHPKRWHWLLTTNHRHCVPRDSAIYSLHDTL